MGDKAPGEHVRGMRRQDVQRVLNAVILLAVSRPTALALEHEWELVSGRLDRTGQSFRAPAESRSRLTSAGRLAPDLGRHGFRTSRECPAGRTAGASLTFHSVLAVSLTPSVGACGFR